MSQKFDPETAENFEDVRSLAPLRSGLDADLLCRWRSSSRSRVRRKPVVLPPLLMLTFHSCRTSDDLLVNSREGPRLEASVDKDG